MQEDIKPLINMLKQYPQQVRLGALIAFALLGRWLFFTRSIQAMLLGYLSYVGIAVYLTFCVVRHFAKRR